MVGSFSNGKDMRWHLIPPLASVQSNSSHGVDGEPLVGIHSNTEETRVGIDKSLNISLFQVEENRGIIEVGQVGHVLTAVILRRVNLGDQISLELLSLTAGIDLDLDLVAIGLLNQTL